MLLIDSWPCHDAYVYFVRWIIHPSFRSKLCINQQFSIKLVSYSGILYVSKKDFTSVILREKKHCVIERWMMRKPFCLSELARYFFKWLRWLQPMWFILEKELREGRTSDQLLNVITCCTGGKTLTWFFIFLLLNHEWWHNNFLWAHWTRLKDNTILKEKESHFMLLNKLHHPETIYTFKHFKMWCSFLILNSITRFCFRSDQGWKQTFFKVCLKFPEKLTPLTFSVQIFVVIIIRYLRLFLVVTYLFFDKADV